MKRLFFISILLFSLFSLSSQAQILPVQEQAVVLNTKEGSIKGKLLLPNGGKTWQVVLLIAGSGPTDMDGNSAIGNMKNNSLKFLAQKLAENDIASLRFDKRGIASSAAAGKEESKLRFNDYVDDVIGWIDFLAKDRRFTNITVIGHSEGSLIGMLACKDRPKVNGFVSLAGAGRSAYEVIEAQVAAQQLPEAMQKEVATINESLKGGNEVTNVPVYLQSLFRTSVQPYLISWYKYNPQTIISTLKIPTLIIQGKTDIQVSTLDAELLKKACPSARLVLIDAMNHVLKNCETTNQLKQMAIYTDPSLPVNETLVSSISSFVKNKK